MYEALKAIAATLNLPFFYGRSDFQNLYNEIEQKNVSHIFLDPVQISDVDNDNGITEQTVCSGSFMLVFSSDIDEIDYNYRYENYIKPILDGDLKTIKEAIRCGYDVRFDSWRTIEVINAFDYNFDGVICTYQITFDV